MPNNIQLILKLPDTVNKEVYLCIFQLSNFEDKITVRTFIIPFKKHEELVDLEDARNMITDREYKNVSSSLAYLQDQLMKYSKKFDLFVTIMTSSSTKKQFNYLMRNGPKGTKDMINIITSIKEFLDDGKFHKIPKGITKCF